MSTTNISLNNIGQISIPTAYSGSNSVLKDTQGMGAMRNCTSLFTGVPDMISDVKGPNNLRAYNFAGLQYDLTGTLDYNHLKRYMVTEGWSVGALSNMYFIVLAGTYALINWCDSTTFYKNGSSLTSVTNAGTTTTGATTIFSKGDRIEANKPFSLWYYGTGGTAQLPGLSGAYAGFSGYSFATRNDRESATNANKLEMFSTNHESDGGGGGFIEVRSVSNTGTTFTSTTDTFDDEWGGVVGENYDVSMVNGNCYFAQSNRLFCCWRGRAISTNLYDTVPMFPMTTEVKYGWYSSGGHLLAAAGPQQNIDGSSTGYQVKTRTSTTTTTEFTQNTSGASWVRNDANTGANTGTFFAGSPAATYIGNGPDSTTGAGPAFTCESQGDGNGTEMTPHVSEMATKMGHHTFTCTPGTADWVAFLSPGATIEEYVVIQFNSSRNFDSSQALGNSTTGYVNTTDYPYTSCRFTDGLGAGNVYVCTGPMLAWYDTDSSDDDETILQIGEVMDGFTFTNFTIYGDDATASGLSTTTGGACSPAEAISQTVSSPVSYITAGMVLFTSNNFENPFLEFTGKDPAEGGWARLNLSRTTTAILFGDYANGRVTSTFSCSDRRLKKNIEKVGTSPSGINIYQFEYIDEKHGVGRFEGAMSQELLEHTIEHDNGELWLSYDNIDVRFKEV